MLVLWKLTYILRQLILQKSLLVEGVEFVVAAEFVVALELLVLGFQKNLQEGFLIVFLEERL